jgi:alkanesulfonate monooxygenase SsuD/methylene tetrahydromethanopterin reductase-like flavin-dependent oxidoreductase (luciferase family)
MLGGRIGLGVIPGAGWGATDIQNIARESEAAGFDAIFATEVNNDVLATAQLMGSATDTIQVGTWVANIFLRHSYVCAQAAALIAEITGGRFILGLGVSHEPVNGALEIDMRDPPAAVVRYASDVKRWLRGEGPATHLPQRAASYPVPVYIAALTSTTVENACKVADGLMPLFWSPERVAKSKTWIDRARQDSPDMADIELTLGLPTFIGDDRDALYDAARQNLGLYTTFPFFQHLFRVMNFETEADEMEAGAGGTALSDRLLDAVCLIGSTSACRERLEEYRNAGVDLPILMPPIGVDGARALIAAFAR